MKIIKEAKRKAEMVAKVSKGHILEKYYYRVDENYDVAFHCIFFRDGKTVKSCARKITGKNAGLKKRDGRATGRDEM